MADFDQLKGWVQEDWRFHGKWRERAREDYDFFAGEQWDAITKAELADMNRVPIVFNRIAPIIHAVAGSEINNRTEVRFLPRTMGDAKVNETLTAGAEWFRDQAQAEEEESHAFMDTLICGLGVTETTLDFEIDPEGHPKIERHDPLECFWDKNAHKRGLSDAQRVGRIIHMPMREAQERFPEAADTELDAAWIEGREEEGEHWTTAGDQYAEGDGETPDANRDTVRIVQVQWRERVREVEYVDPQTGQRGKLPAAKWEQLTKAQPALASIPSRTLTRWKWRQAFLGGKVLKENVPCEEAATLKFITGHYRRSDKQWFGLLESMKDPQKFANKWLTQSLHILNSNAKGGILYESDAVDDPREFEDNWAAADSAQLVKPGALSSGKIQEKPKAQYPVAFMQLTEFAVSSIRDVSGVNLELLGMREANQPGVLEYQRRQSAMTTLAGLFDALRLYRKNQGGVILYFLRRHIAPSGRLVRIEQDGQATYQPLDVGDDAVRYDVIVDDAPSAPNQKEKTWEFIQQLMPLLQNMGLPPDVWLEIAEHSPLPAALIEKLRQFLQKAQENPEQNQAAMLEMEKVKSEIAENQANAAYDMARAEKERAEIGQTVAETQKTVTETQLAPLSAMPALSAPFGPR